MDDNRGYCNSCDQLIPVSRLMRDGKVYLVKNCVHCGVTETVLSSDSARYQRKQDFAGPLTQSQAPRAVLVEVTSACNINCPTCMSNVGKSDAAFNPPLQYFDRLFSSLALRKPAPHVELFGGEPTTRDDLPVIIETGLKFGLNMSVSTNGVRLMDEQYCRRLLSTGAGIHFQFDGMDSSIYRLLRGDESLLEKKMAALENVGKHARGPVLIFCTLARGINDNLIPDIINFCHERRDFIKGLYLIPLAHTWDNGDVQFHWSESERLTVEDVEASVSQRFGGMEFLPAGHMEMPVAFQKVLKPHLAFLGASPNCESMSFLISTGKGYVPLSRYLKTSFYDFAQDLRKEARRIEGQNGSAKAAGWMADPFRSLRAAALVRKHINLKEALKAKGMKKYGDLLRLLLSLPSEGKRREVFQEITGLGPLFRLLVLPYRDKFQYESQCMEQCPVVVGYLEPADQSLQTVPLCSWKRRRSDVLSKFAPCAPQM